MASMRWVACVALLALCGLCSATRPLHADEPAEAQGGSALENGLGALRLRMQAKLKEADLLEKSGRLEEALAATREVERLYREGLADLQRLLAAAGAGGGARSAPPAPTPDLSVGKVLENGVPEDEVPEEEVLEEYRSEHIKSDPGFQAPVGGAFPGRGARPEQPADSSRADAVVHALRWLVAHQSPDGGWESAGFPRWCDGKANGAERPDGAGKPMYDVGVTGLALSAFLGAGYTHRGDHEFAKAVRRGLNYLKNLQDPEGCFGPRNTQHYIYNHAIASVAMVEAFGMTEALIHKGSAQRGLDFLALCRNPYFGWRYGVKPGDNDTSTTVWAVMALKSARLINAHAVSLGKPAPLVIDEESFAGAKAWLDKMTDPDSGRVGYVSRGSGPARPQELVDRFPAEKSESMTAAGVLMRIYLGEDPRTSDTIKKGVALMSALPPTWNVADGSIDMYYWVYGTLAMFQAGGEAWNRWDSALSTSVVAHQRADGSYCGSKGSWDPIDPWGPDGGRVYATALMTLCCEVLNRYERAFGAK